MEDEQAVLEGEISVGAALGAGSRPLFWIKIRRDRQDSATRRLEQMARKAGVPVEFHSYAEGGHAFGLRRTKFPATKWPDLVETWLHTLHIIE